MNSIKLLIPLLIVLAFFWLPFFPGEAAGHGITDPWVHQRIAWKAADVWGDCPTEIKGHAPESSIEAFLPLECMVPPYPGYQNAHDIVIGSGEEDREKNPFCGPLLRCAGDNEGRNGFMEHFWQPDEINGNSYNCDSSAGGRYNKGLLYNWPTTPYTIQYDSAYRLAQDYWDNKVLRLYREGKWENDPKKIDEAYYWLGRVAHLLTDMCVPAHVHLLPHADYPGLMPDEADYFETYFDKDHPDRILRYKDNPNIGPEYRFENLPNMSAFMWEEVHERPSNLFRLFWYTAQKTQYYASSGEFGTLQAAGNITYKKLDGSTGHFQTSLWNGENVTIINDPQHIPANLDKMADALIPHAMKAVAGLYRLFWFEANLIKWKYPLDNSSCYSPAVGQDNTIYAPSGTNLLAINSDGTLKWDFQSNGTVANPSIGQDGILYFQTSTDGVCAIDSNKNLLWTYYPGGVNWGLNCAFKIGIGQDNVLYACGGGGLHAIDSLGNGKWVSTGTVPAIPTNGPIYTVVTNRLVARNKSNGSIIWSSLAASHAGEPSIGVNGEIYVNDPYKLRAFYPNGVKKWEYNNLGSFVESGQAAIGPSGVIYLPSFDYYNSKGYVHAVYQDGRKKWTFPTDWPSGSPIVGNDDTLYFLLYNGLLAFNEDGNIIWRLSGFGTQSWTSPVMGPDGTIYIIGSERHADQLYYPFLYAIRTSGTGLAGGASWPTKTTGPAKSSWPMFGANAQHTFRANFKTTTLPFLHLLLGD